MKLKKELRKELSKVVDLKDVTIKWCIKHPTLDGKIPSQYLGGKTQRQARAMCSVTRQILKKEGNLRKAEIKRKEDEAKREDIERTRILLMTSKERRFEIIKENEQKRSVTRLIREMTKVMGGI